MRLIDADALKARYDEKHKGSPGRARELITEAPTIDAEPVVRCKDCVNYCGFEHCKNGICDVDSVSKRAVYPDDFCSYGERRKTND